MKLHSDILTKEDVLDAARAARVTHGQDIYVDEIAVRGSRKRQRGITFYCVSEHGKRAAGRSRSGTTAERAASWSAYGYLIAELFNRDPDAIIGQLRRRLVCLRPYKNVDDFRERCESYTPRGESTDFLKVLNTGSTQTLAPFDAFLGG